MVVAVPVGLVVMAMEDVVVVAAAATALAVTAEAVGEAPAVATVEVMAPVARDMEGEEATAVVAEEEMVVTPGWVVVAASGWVVAAAVARVMVNLVAVAVAMRVAVDLAAEERAMAEVAVAKAGSVGDVKEGQETSLAEVVWVEVVWATAAEVAWATAAAADSVVVSTEALVVKGWVGVGVAVVSQEEEAAEASVVLQVAMAEPKASVSEEVAMKEDETAATQVGRAASVAKAEVLEGARAARALQGCSNACRHILIGLGRTPMVMHPVHSRLRAGSTPRPSRSSQSHRSPGHRHTLRSMPHSHVLPVGAEAAATAVAVAVARAAQSCSSARRCIHSDRSHTPMMPEMSQLGNTPHPTHKSPGTPPHQMARCHPSPTRRLCTPQGIECLR